MKRRTSSLSSTPFKSVSYMRQISVTCFARNLSWLLYTSPMSISILRTSYIKSPWSVFLWPLAARLLLRTPVLVYSIVVEIN